VELFIAASVPLVNGAELVRRTASGNACTAAMYAWGSR
jgi:hypothetical protein